MPDGRSSAGMPAASVSITTARTLSVIVRGDAADQRREARIDEQHAVAGMVDDVGDVVRPRAAD